MRYFNLHMFGTTLVLLGEKTCVSPEEFKAWSPNLGHEGVLTTFYNYGEVQPSRQSEIFTELRAPRLRKSDASPDEIAKAVVKEMQQQKLDHER